MADERLTKKERREQRRRERRQQEVEEARRQRRRRILTIAGTIAAVAGIAAIFWFTREPPTPDGITIEAADAQEAIETAGCEPVDIPAPTSTQHLSEPAPSADELYPVRPTHSGPHFANTAPVGSFDEYVDERQVVHNLEHGSVVVWWDPDQAEDTGAIEEWADTRLRMGFSPGSGAGIIASPFERGLGEGKTVALRAWGVALNCEEWNQTVADAFLASNYGTRGQAPERSFARYPEGALEIEGTIEQPTSGATAGDESTSGETAPEASPTG